MGLLIGIGGVSRAGKTTLSNYILNLYPNKKSLIIAMDDYVIDQDKIPRIKDRIDWETPASVDYDRIANKIAASVSEYDLVITEGILIFYSEDVKKEFSTLYLFKLQ